MMPPEIIIKITYLNPLKSDIIFN